MYSFAAACISVLLLVVVLSSAGQEAPSKAVPVAQEPSHHLALENKYTRVFKVEVPVGHKTLLHRHDHDYVFVTLGPAEIENAVQGKTPVKQTLRDGDTRYVRGRFAHVASNVGGTPFRNVTIEILRAGAERPAMEDEPTPAADHGSVSRFLVNNSKVRVKDVQIRAGGALDRSKLPRLLVAVSECNLVPAASGWKAKHLAAGDIEWLPAGQSLARTQGTRPARLISIEYR